MVKIRVAAICSDRLSAGPHICSPSAFTAWPSVAVSFSSLFREFTSQSGIACLHRSLPTHQRPFCPPCEKLPRWRMAIRHPSALCSSLLFSSTSPGWLFSASGSSSLSQYHSWRLPDSTAPSIRRPYDGVDHLHHVCRRGSVAGSAAHVFALGRALNYCRGIRNQSHRVIPISDCRSRAFHHNRAHSLGGGTGDELSSRSRWH